MALHKASSVPPVPGVRFLRQGNLRGGLQGCLVGAVHRSCVSVILAGPAVQGPGARIGHACRPWLWFVF